MQINYRPESLSPKGSKSKEFKFSKPCWQTFLLANRQAFLKTCSNRKLLVSFNGKSFDVPYITARAAANGIPCMINLAHFDLLHECRRVWKDVLPDCKLQTLERYVCGRHRYGDIPGAEIPDAYHAFVRTGNASQIADILRHNMLDLITLADIMTQFPGA